MLSDDKTQLYAARRVLDENPAVCAALDAVERHFLAEQVADAVVAAIDVVGQATRHVVLDTEGNPHCSWCGRMGCNDGEDPIMSPLHPQYGLMCTCVGPRKSAAEAVLSG